MAGAKNGTQLAASLARRQLIARPAPCAARFASTAAQESKSSKVDTLADIEQNSSFSTPAADDAAVKAYNTPERVASREAQLPGTRYQYHPPKYYRGPLHPVQMPPSSDPTARDFVPGPFNLPRLRQTYETTIASDLLTLTYQHLPPGAVVPESKKGELREWDGSSPYHKNRPRRGPRGGGSSRLNLLERDINFNNIPSLLAVSVNSFAPEASGNKEYLQVARSVVQAITGVFPEVTTMRKGVVQWKVRKGDKTGAKVTLYGGQAYEFVDKLITHVLPKIKDWPGVKASSGDDNGNIALGLTPDSLAFFPELESNFSMYPAKLVPGCNIYIHTTGTSDRHGRLLLEALGFPFYGKVKH